MHASNSFSFFTFSHLPESLPLCLSSFYFLAVVVYTLAIGMGTGGTFVEVPALPGGLTVVPAFAVDPEDPREVFCDPVLSSDWL